MIKEPGGQRNQSLAYLHIATNVVIFITRQYGGTHLGNRRFEIVKDLGGKSLGKT